MKKKAKPKKKGFPVYLIYWTDATKQDTPGDIPLTPANGVTAIMKPEIGEAYIRGYGEVFDDGDCRLATAIPAGMVKKIVRVGFAPSIAEVFKTRRKKRT